jgi:hypothetical protein
MLDSQLTEIQAAERHKIYSSQAAKSKPAAATNVFPPILQPTTAVAHQDSDPNGVHPALAMLNHIEKLRNGIKERDLECHALRHENSTLKQASLLLLTVVLD